SRRVPGATPMKLFTRGNDKVGKDVLIFNLPVFETCPGSTAFCRSHCYADWGHYRWRLNRRRNELTYRVSLSPHFPAVAVAELRAARVPKRRCRVHSSGDFYDAGYIRKWVDIATATPEWEFWAYTRSWRRHDGSLSDLLPELERLAALPNFFLWLSVDHETGMPPEVPAARGEAVMLAPGMNIDWMKPDETPRSKDRLLGFPVKDEDRTPVKRMGLVMVCPHYNGTPEDKVQTCEDCKFCFTAPRR